MLLALAAMPLLGSCATSANRANRANTVGAAASTNMEAAPGPIVLEAVARPRSPQEASAVLGEAMVLMQRGAPARALPRLEAVLHTDYLTDRGRADLYWLVAEASRDVDDARHADALAGYLVASSLLPDDPEVLQRSREAETELLLRRVRERGLGASAQRAIVVDNEHQARRVMEGLHCGVDGDGRYVERRLPPSLQDDSDDGEMARRLLCTENGDERVLWFRIEQ